MFTINNGPAANSPGRIGCNKMRGRVREETGDISQMSPPPVEVGQKMRRKRELKVRKGTGHCVQMDMEELRENGPERENLSSEIYLPAKPFAVFAWPGTTVKQSCNDETNVVNLLLGEGEGIKMSVKQNPNILDTRLRHQLTLLEGHEPPEEVEDPQGIWGIVGESHLSLSMEKKVIQII
jgi:hypothetical protein